MHDDRKMAGPDFITSIVLMALGTAIAVVSYKMKVFRTIIVSPGLFPLILGCVFVFFGLIIFVIAARRGGFGQALGILSPGYLREVWRSPRFRRGMTVFLLILAYVALFGNHYLARLNFTIHAGDDIIPVNVGFLLVTAGYLFSTFVYLKAMKWPVALTVSLVAAVAIFYAFNKGFGIPIP